VFTAKETKRKEGGIKDKRNGNIKEVSEGQRKIRGDRKRENEREME
jgi:hypothetical protein